MPLERREVVKNLKKKGFQESQNDHSWFRYYFLSGEASPIRTKVSHGNFKDIDDSLVTKMAKQCEITRNEFINLIKCSLKQEAYEELLRNKGI